MNVNVYTDASFSIKHKLAACGYIVFIGWRMVKHDIVLVDNIKSSQQSEILAIEFALDYIKDNHILAKSINVNSDCRSVVLFKGRQNQYKSLKRKIEYFSSLNIGVSLLHVKAHRRNKNNNKVDESVRDALRDFISKK